MFKKIFSIILICLLLTSNVDVKAVTYAYSIGTSWADGRDYTVNVLNTKKLYANINNLESKYHVMPTGTYIRGNNPNGNRIIASKLVFLNGPSNFQRIYFNHQGNSSYMSGVCTGNDKVDEGYTFAGLNSTDMSTCKVITFAGSETAYNDATYKNLAEKAVSKGAKTAVGWRDCIYTLSTDGRYWLGIYNQNLAAGKTVSESIRAAVNAYPADALTTCVQIAGDPTRVVATAASIEETSTVTLENMENIESNYFTNKIILKELLEYDNTIDLTDYKATVNMFDPINGDGYVIFTYYINGDIKTNKAYICHIEGNSISYITNTVEHGESATTYETSEIMNEEEIISKVNSHKTSMVSTATVTNLVNLECSEEFYYYDYNTNTLSYREYISVNNPITDAIDSTVNEEKL